MNHIALQFQLFSFPKGETVANNRHALERVLWAIKRTETALCQPSSVEGQALHQYGFVAIILKGVVGDEVLTFDEGHCSRLSADGLHLRKVGAQARVNVSNALAALRLAADYLSWVVKVDESRVAAARPPVFDPLIASSVNPKFRLWAGSEAFDYVEAWHEKRRDEVARVAAAAKANSLQAVG